MSSFPGINQDLPLPSQAFSELIKQFDFLLKYGVGKGVSDGSSDFSRPLGRFLPATGEFKYCKTQWLLHLPLKNYVKFSF